MTNETTQNDNDTRRWNELVGFSYNDEKLINETIEIYAPFENGRIPFETVVDQVCEFIKKYNPNALFEKSFVSRMLREIWAV